MTPWQSKHPAARTHLVHADQVFATVADTGVVEFADGVFHLFTGVVLDNTFPAHAVSFGMQRPSEEEVGGQRVNEIITRWQAQAQAHALSAAAREHISEYDAATLTSVVLK